MAAELGFTEDQQQYLEGFIVEIAGKRGISLPNDTPSGKFADTAAPASKRWRTMPIAASPTSSRGRRHECCRRQSRPRRLTRERPLSV